MPRPKSRTESATPKSKRRRPRPTPKWLREQKDLDEIARRRCLLILSVLSGEKPVTDAIAEAKISRQMYYQLEDKALHAMLRALSPTATSEQMVPAGAVKRAQALEAKLAKLEADKRRSDHLLFLTRKLVGRGRMKTAAGRRPKPSKKRYTASKRHTTSSPSSTKSPNAASIPTPDGADERCAGTES